MQRHLDKLNPEQRRAATRTEGPLLVLAGAGTGKTRVVTTRIAVLLHKGVPGERILGLTFTNKAAAEMRDRAAALVGRQRARPVTLGTFHSFCARLLRAHGEALGLPRDFAICDSSDQLAAVKNVLRDLRVSETAIHPRALHAAISLLKNRGVAPERAADDAVDDRDALVAAAYARYDEALRRGRTLDFDDLLLRALELFDRAPESAARIRERYRYVMVDEYQDTNAPQYEIVRRIGSAHGNVCVVGDDDQSIYGWRGADVTKILNFARDFPGAEVVRLETNYRSAAPILEAANAVIRCNPSRHEKTLRSALGPGEPVRVFELKDEQAEAEFIVKDLLGAVRRGRARLRDCAILFRTQSQPRALEAELRRKGVPYVLVGGMSFFDRKEVRDVLAFLKLVANPDDEVSLLRVVNCPPRGVGKTTVDRALALAAEHGLKLADAFARPEIPPAAARAVAALRVILARFRDERDLVAVVRGVVEAVGYRAEIERCYPDAKTREQRWLGVAEIWNFAENHACREDQPTLSGFLEDLSLAAADERAPDEGRREAVTLMTLHAAKGLEFTRVYLPGFEEGLLPHARSVADDAVEEERRLCYVGITRAKRILTITHAAERARHGRRAPTVPSRFLNQVTSIGDVTYSR